MLTSRAAWAPVQLLHSSCSKSAVLASPSSPQACTSTISVYVASKNKVKLNAVEAAFSRCLDVSRFNFISVESDSAVSAQPFGNEETLAGARNRVESARAMLQPSQITGSYGLLAAIEGGVRPTPAYALQGPQATAPLECFAWVVLESLRGDASSCASSASFVLPPALTRLIVEEGMELGAADDLVFGRVHSGQGSGTIGHLSRGAISRQAYYEEAAICALLPFLHPRLYGEQYDLQLPGASQDPC